MYVFCGMLSIKLCEFYLGLCDYLNYDVLVKKKIN